MGNAPMSGKSKKQKSVTEVKIPDEFEDAFGALGDATEQLTGRALSTPYRTVGFTPAQNQALSIARNTGVDPALNQAARLFGNNQGIQGLRGINIGAERSGALTPLRNFNSDELRRLDFDALKGFRPNALQGLTFDQLEATARGDNLDVANNPFLQEALANAQRITTERFTRDVQPALAAQFGGGFGLTGSSSINAQRRAAEDLSRTLGEQATSTFADQFNRERQLQEAASSQLGQLGLSRAQGIDQLGFNRASELGQLGLQRGSQIDANQLARGQSLGQLGLGFTQAGIQRGANLGQLQNQQAQGISSIGQARQAQKLRQAGILGSLGEQQRAIRERSLNAPLDEQIRRLQGIGGIIGLSQGQQTTAGGGGGSQAGGVLGGALSGAGLGAAVGSAVPGVGTLFGAGIGALGGGLFGAL